MSDLMGNRSVKVAAVEQQRTVRDADVHLHVTLVDGVEELTVRTGMRSDAKKTAEPEDAAKAAGTAAKRRNACPRQIALELNGIAAIPRRWLQTRVGSR